MSDPSAPRSSAPSVAVPEPSPAGTAGPALSPLRGRLTVAAVAFAVFSLVTTEMLPVGLLTPMSAALQVSPGTAGLAMTLPGVVAALSAPPLALAVGRHDRRPVLCLLMVLLTAANLATAFAPHFAVLLGARVLIGLAIGGIWPIAVGIAGRLVPERAAPAATSVIFGGIAVGFVVGVPLGTFVGGLGNWRIPFALMGLGCFLVLVALAVLLPPLPSRRAVRLAELPDLLRNARLRTGLLVTALLVTGHFSVYTYLRPLLESVAGTSPELLSGLLLGYGAAGVAGNFLAGTRAHRAPGPTLVAVSVLLAGSVVLIPPFGAAPVAAWILLIGWGTAYGGVSLSAQAWVLRVAPAAGDVASALFISVFNASISLGALTGGRIADGGGLHWLPWFGGALVALVPAVLWGAGGRRTR
ncbi:MFS transporter [Streptomyces sp. LP05-1]|uniref:MFS transporter n=1 Tax=Streptomyces pyxinae TaxID=2970734 RepID=A0ABT2CDF4_9ACTN|nr:MFS transporter [Streptomyces sp. LP05-1]MCS0635440.1 MFS transporter [Streptomyces sp. LP05-1]